MKNPYIKNNLVFLSGIEKNFLFSFFFNASLFENHEHLIRKTQKNELSQMNNFWWATTVSDFPYVKWYPSGLLDFVTYTTVAFEDP